MNRKGVTLIELIVVTVIIAIGAVFLVPNIGAWLPNYRLRSATRDIVSTMRSAQMKAVSTNMRYRVSLTQNPPSYILEHEISTDNWTSDGDGPSQALPSGISIFAINIAGNKAVFNPNSTSSSGSMTLQNSKKAQRQITLAPSTGRIKIQSFY